MAQGRGVGPVQQVQGVLRGDGGACAGARAVLPRRVRTIPRVRKGRSVDAGGEVVWRGGWLDV